MTKDLEETLEELGPEYRRTLEYFLSLPLTRPEAPSMRERAAHALLSRRVKLAAAAIAAVATIAAVFILAPARPQKAPLISMPRRAPAKYLLAFQGKAAAHLLAQSQSPDGSWEGNDFITRQNAYALGETDPSSIAYRKALRYLRSKGLAPARLALR